MTDSKFKKGIILAGGAGTRLYPLTRVVTKQLLPVYDKPMVYYPLSVLMLAGIRQVLIISSPCDRSTFKGLFGDGRQLGLWIEYAEQVEPGGIAQALVVGRECVGHENIVLALGDNIFFGTSLQDKLDQATRQTTGATVFAYPVGDPSRYGIVKLDPQGQATSVEEKPKAAKSNLAVTGLYFYDRQVCDIAATLTPSPRGELEVTDINREYLRRGQLNVIQLGRGFTWLDTGTHTALLQAGTFVETIESRQGLKVACLEEIAFRKGFISSEQLSALADEAAGDYAAYLRAVEP